MLSQLRDRGVQSTALLRSSGTVIRCFARLEITLTGETNDCEASRFNLATSFLLKYSYSSPQCIDL
jgi:hypothetical protein